MVVLALINNIEVIVICSTSAITSLSEHWWLVNILLIIFTTIEAIISETMLL
jgi:hypothetical protein